MFPIERQQEILNILNKKKAVNVLELSKTLYVGPATIRRDLEDLERKNMLKRTHGGAILLGGANIEIPFAVREHEQASQKEQIARIAASFVSSDTLIMDSSSSTIRMIPHLAGKNILSVITNGVRTSMLLGDVLRKNIYCTGGILRENSLSFAGHDAETFLEKYYVDKAFFSCRGLSMERGMTDSFSDEAELRKIMIAHSRESYLLCDYTKFNKNYFCNIGGLEKITAVITDQNPGDEWLGFLKKIDVKCIYSEVFP